MEVIVALSLVGLVAVATLPLLVGTVRAASNAKSNTQAKNLAQQRIEQMRNMVFRVEALNGAPVVDLLDRYYRNVQTVASSGDVCSTRAYVPVGGTVQAGEPAPPFYRCTIGSLPGYPGFSQSIATQFLGEPRTSPTGAELSPPSAVAPPAGYDTQVAGKDETVSRLIGVSIVTTWRDAGGRAKTHRAYTQIADSAAPRQTIVGEAKAVAVRITSAAANAGTPSRLVFEAGVLDLRGSTYTGSTAGLSVTGAYAELDGQPRAAGRLVAAGAPPVVNVSDLTAGEAGGVLGTCAYACFGPSTASNLKASSASGLPLVATAANQLSTTLGSGSVGGDTVNGFRFTNVPDSTTTSNLRLVGPVLLSTAPASDGTYASAKGYLESTATTRTVTAKAAVTTGTIGVLPTSFALGGVVRVRLDSAAVSCVSSTAGASASSTPSGPTPGVVVEYLPAGTSSYAPLAAGANLTTLRVGPTVAASLPLSAYLAAAPVRGAVAPVSQSNGRYGEATLQAALRLSTVPTRLNSGGQPDPDSAVNLELGVLSCSSEDQR